MQIQQLTDYGTGDPIVARLSVQTQDLLQFYRLTDTQKQRIFGLMFSDIQPKLMTCSRIMNQLKKEVEENQKVVEERGVAIQGGGRAYTCPSIFDLRPRAETFLYHAKAVLRDLTQIFMILFSKNFHKSARYDQVVTWCAAELGAENELTRMLREDESTWIRKLVNMRNAVEHPGGHSGVLNVENFTCTVENKRVIVAEPVWYLNNEPKTAIAPEMQVFVENLLTLCEETLILCLERFKKGFPILVVEIPEQDRRLECPVRFRMTIDTAKVQLPSATNGEYQPHA